MPTTAWSAASSASESSGQDVPWSNLANAAGAPDGAFASAALGFGSTPRRLLLGFASLSAQGVPAGVGATVRGIEVRIRAAASGAAGSGQLTDLRFTRGATTSAARGPLNLGGTLGDVSAGGAADLWGLTWAESDLSTGLTLGMGGTETTESVPEWTLQVDAAEMRVTYDDPPPPPTPTGPSFARGRSRGWREWRNWRT